MPAISRASAEELKIINENNMYILILTVIITVINLITLLFNRKDKILFISYGCM